MAARQRQPEGRNTAPRTARTAAGSSGGGARSAWWLLLLILATLAAYHPAWHGSPLWDDEAHLTRADLQSADGLRRIWTEPGATQQYYPLLHSAFWAIHALWGEDPLSYHLASIVLHAVAAFLLGLILRRLAVPWPWLAACTFALHPVQVESVAWMSELKNTLSGAFAFAAALAYLRFDAERTRTAYAAAIALFVAALLSKTVTATLPVLLAIGVWWKRGRIDWRRDLRPLAPLLALGVAAGAFTTWAERVLIGARGAGFDLSLVERTLLAGRAFWFHLWTLAWPEHRTFVYPRWDVSAMVWWQYGYPLAFVAVLAIAWWWRGRRRAPLAALVGYTVALAPALGFVNVYPFRFSYVADHFQYLASAVAFAVVAGALGSLAGRIGPGTAWPRVVAACAIVLPLGLLTWRQSHDYTDAETLYRATIRRNPSAWMALNNLAVIRLTANVEEAMGYLDEALRLNPDYPEAHDTRGLALQLLGRYEEALAEHDAALRLEPAFPQARNNRGTALQKLGRLEEAADAYRTVIALRPESPQGYANLGNVLMEMGRPADAVPGYDRALAIDPALGDIRYNRAAALAAAGRTTEAIAGFRELAARGSAPADVHVSLGVLLSGEGRLDEATPHLEAAVRARPGDAALALRLANVLYAQGLLERAAAEYARLLQLTPDSVEAHNNLGACLERLGRAADAVGYYEAASRLRPDSAEVRANLARTRRLAVRASR